MSTDSDTRDDFEYVVVGSGAGGGTLAARLAEAGCKVLLLEAGGDPPADGRGKVMDAGRDVCDDYEVPAFHTFASEHASMRWDFFVRHYASDEQQRKDPKHVKIADKPYILYPRAGTLGGCTAHHAMITVYPHNDDWDHIARVTGEDSWRAENMRGYFERMENCHHRAFPYRWLGKLGLNRTRHGWDGWLHTEKAIPKAALKDDRLVDTIRDAAHVAIHGVRQPFGRLRWFLLGQADPNDWRLVQDDAVGLRYVPHSTHGHKRIGARERLLQVAEEHQGNLTIELDALATRVILDADKRAVAVEYQKGARLYDAHPESDDGPCETRTARATCEVILAGGAFNTPQLLMLSGIGPREELERHGIDVKIPLAGVGKNLQDRYEVSVVNRMKLEHNCWEVLQGARFTAGDRPYTRWAKQGWRWWRSGPYTGNGGVLSVIKRSAATRSLPDLYCVGFLGNFYGYFPGYSKLLPKGLDYFTWAVLKAHTNNTAGSVTLRSANPRDTPHVNFHYFDEGNDHAGEDLASVVEGVRFAREMTKSFGDRVEVEELPGEHVQSREDLEQFVKANAWGHHASCTCPIGDPANGGVLTGDFRVHGAKNLRVVDASVFPRIPGFFIVTSVYMVAEKAADVILAAAGKARKSS